MSYRIRFRSRAKEELNRAMDYGADFSEALGHWISEISETAEGRPGSSAVDLLEVLQEGIEDSRSGWNESWKKWWAATPLDKVRALITVARKRCPPWELRATGKYFHGILGVFRCEVIAIYEINHVDRELVFAAFSGLPGEGD